MGTKFIKVKKTSEPYYIVPETFASKIGILNISESGICRIGETIYSKAFMVNETVKKKASSNETIKGSMMVLRGYDVPFKYIEYASGEVVLDIHVNAKDFEEAKIIIEHLENDMKGSLHTFNILINAMNLQDRLYFLHQRFMNEVKDARIDVNDYIKNVTWSADIDVFKRWKETNKLLSTEVGCKGYFYARRMPTENVGTLYELIRNHKGVTDIMIDYEPISDLDVYRKIHEIYDDVLTEGSPKENERRYLMAGIYFMISGTEEFVEQKFEQLRKKVYLYGCRITPFYFKQFHAFKAFANFSTEGIRQLRLVQVTNAVKASPFHEEVKKESEETSILDAFDSLMNTKNIN